MLVLNYWLKDIKMCGQECRLSTLEAVQLVKDSTSDNARGAMEFYLDTNSTWNYKALIEHLRTSYKMGESLAHWVVTFIVKVSKIGRLRINLQMISRYLVGRSSAFTQSGRLKWTKPWKHNWSFSWLTTALWQWCVMFLKCKARRWHSLRSKPGVGKSKWALLRMLQMTPHLWQVQTKLTEQQKWEIEKLKAAQGPRISPQQLGKAIT